MPQAVENIFSQSIEALAEEAQSLFSALAVFATIDFSRNATIALAHALHLPTPELYTNTLVMRSLVNAFLNDNMPRKISDNVRFRLHPLLYALADKKFGSWIEEKRRDTFKALASYYAEYSNRLLHESARFG